MMMYLIGRGGSVTAANIVRQTSNNMMMGRTIPRYDIGFPSFVCVMILLYLLDEHIPAAITVINPGSHSPSYNIAMRCLCGSLLDIMVYTARNDPPALSCVLRPLQPLPSIAEGRGRRDTAPTRSGSLPANPNKAYILHRGLES